MAQSCISVAVADGCSSDSSPSLGTSICRRCGPKKTRKEEEKKIPLQNFGSLFVIALFSYILNICSARDSCVRTSWPPPAFSTPAWSRVLRWVCVKRVGCSASAAPSAVLGGCEQTSFLEDEPRWVRKRPCLDICPGFLWAGEKRCLVVIGTS